MTRPRDATGDKSGYLCKSAIYTPVVSEELENRRENPRRSSVSKIALAAILKEDSLPSHDVSGIEGLRVSDWLVERCESL